MKTKLFLSVLFAVQLQLSFAQSWQQKSANFDATYNGIAWITAADDVSAYAISQDLINELVITRDGGATWHTQVIPGLEDYYFTGADAASANTVYVVGQTFGFESGDLYYGGGSKVMKSTDGGKTWVRKGTNIYSDSLASFADLIFFCTASSGVIFGDPQDGYFEIYTTQNGGNAWSRVPAANIPAPLPDEYGILFFGDKLGNTIWAGTWIADADFNISGGRLLQSDDKGATWYVRNASMPITSGDIVMRFSSPSVGLFKNGGNLYRTIDGGTTWNEVNYSGTYFGYCFDNVPGLPGAWISTGGDERWLVPDLVHGLGSSITYDDGNTWTVIDTAVDHSNVLITSRTHGYSGGLTSSIDNKGMFVYSPSCDDASLQVESFTLMNAASDNGTGVLEDGSEIDLSQNPINVRANLCTNAGVGSVRFRLNGSEYRIENTAPFAIAGDSPTGNYNEWHLAPGDYTLTAIPYSGSNGSGTAGVARSITFTIINSGVSKNDVLGTMNATVEGNELMMSAYPNPFNDHLNFEFSLPADSQVSLELFNISGQRVASVFEGNVVGAEINRRVFSAGELASGLYIYRLKTNDAVVTEKVMLAR